MKRHLILSLAAAGLMATTACGSKDSYRSIKANLVEKKILPPSADPTIEQQAESILSKDEQFKKTLASDETSELQQSLMATSMIVNNVGVANADAQAEVTLFTSENSQTCVPTVKKSDEFDRNDITKNKAFVIKNVGRVTCVDKSCDNLILIIEKKGFVSPAVEVQGAVAVLMNRDKNDNVYKPVSTESDVFTQLERIEDRIEQCEKDRAEQKGQDDAQKAVRISEIQEQIKKIDTEIALHRQGKIISDLNASAARIAELNAQKTELQKELDQLKGVSVQDSKKDESSAQLDLNTSAGRTERLRQIDTRLAQINNEISLHQQGKIFSDLNARGARIAELNKEKSSLESEKAYLKTR